MPKRRLRVLVVTYPENIPPARATSKSAIDNDWKMELDLIRALQSMNHQVDVIGVVDQLEPLRLAILERKPDIVFNLLDEWNGSADRDYQIASFLELMEIPYTGCSPKSLLLCRDKALSKLILRSQGISVPDFAVVPKGQTYRTEMPFPLFVKSLTEEASLGISTKSLVKNEKQLQARIKYVHTAIGTDAIVEQFIPGRDLYVGLLISKSTEVLPVWELKFLKDTNADKIATRIVKWDSEFRKKHKITSGHARIAADFEREIQSIAIRCCKALGIDGYARLDFRLTPANELFFIEANPNPNIERNEDMAESAKYHGLGYSEFLSRILESSIDKY